MHLETKPVYYRDKFPPVKTYRKFRRICDRNSKRIIRLKIAHYFHFWNKVKEHLRNAFKDGVLSQIYEWNTPINIVLRQQSVITQN